MTYFSLLTQGIQKHHHIMWSPSISNTQLQVDTVRHVLEMPCLIFKLDSFCTTSLPMPCRIACMFIPSHPPFACLACLPTLLPTKPLVNCHYGWCPHMIHTSPITHSTTTLASSHPYHLKLATVINWLLEWFGCCKHFLLRSFGCHGSLNAATVLLLPWLFCSCVCYVSIVIALSW